LNRVYVLCLKKTVCGTIYHREKRKRADVGQEVWIMTVVRRDEENLVIINAGPVSLEGNLVVPDGASGIVLFAHGSGSSRHSPRNRFVAQVLADAGLATLLMDLLTMEEESKDLYTARLRFDIKMLAERVVAATDWLKANPATAGLEIGYFGSSTGAAAALVASTERPYEVGAVVSRGGRPDLAGPVLDLVRAPTLLIVGGNDEQVIVMNQEALGLLQVEKELRIVPGATHLFEEPGTLEEVARLAAEWFSSHLGKSGD
jgi:putative phosphoribosyl transferase